MKRRTLWLIPLILCGALLLSYRSPFASGKPDVTRHEVQFLGGAVNVQIEWQSSNPVVLVKLSVANIQKEIKIDAYDNKRNPNGYAGETNVTVNLDWMANQPLSYVIQLEDELRVKSFLVTGRVITPGVQQYGPVTQPQAPSMQIQIQQNISQPIGKGFGSITTLISPQVINVAGAMWRVGTGLWKKSEETVSNLPAATYTVEFKDVAGWNTPDNQKVTIEPGDTITLYGIYVR